MRKYAFTSAWARLQVVLGAVIIALGLVLAVLVLMIDLPWPARMTPAETFWGRILGAALCIGLSVAFAAPYIITGQLIHVFLDQRRLLARINRRLRSWDERLPEQEGQEQRRSVAERFMRRK